MRIILLALLFFSYMQTSYAAINLEAKYPYHLENNDIHVVYEGSTVPLYLNLRNFNNQLEEPAEIKITLPKGFVPLKSDKWTIKETNDHVIATSKWELPKDYGQTFDLLYVKAPENVSFGEKKVIIEVTGSTWNKNNVINFTYEKHQKANDNLSLDNTKLDKLKFNWYIQNIIFPVDNLGRKDTRAEDGIIYIRDTSLEGFRNRMTGDGATNWSSFFNHPATHLLLDMRNPQSDIRVLKFKAELIDKRSGEIVPGLCTASNVDDDSEQGWQEANTKNTESTALISLNGDKAPQFIIPLYIDYLNILEGEYNLRVTLSGNGQEKLYEAPIIITKKHSLGLASVGFAFGCLIAVLIFSRKIKNTIYTVGAKGAITIALFAAISFGGITLPTTILKDFLHVFLGPFSGLITGLLNGVLQYLLIMSLLVLFQSPGVLSLMFIVKFMLSALMFGHFTPLAILSSCVSIVVLETTLYFCGYYHRKGVSRPSIFFICLMLGIADAFITFINLEQIMFFSRLYYADWYLALYMLINGLLYSSIGAWLGYKTGLKLRQVMGE